MAGKTPPTYGRAPTLLTHAELKARRERLATNPLAPSHNPSPLSTNTTITAHLTHRTTLQGLGATGAATTSPSPMATERVTWWRRRAYLPVELYIAILTLVISAVNLGAIVWLVMRMRAMP